MLSSAFNVEPASSVTSLTLHPQHVSYYLIQQQNTANMTQTGSKQSVLNTVKLEKSDLVPDKRDDNHILHIQ